ncbi:hypothetical protein EG329_011403 [Mollisiaceae sp. DMI_Dod_QoI]|nr:hypothetical protein EG329_011403 [Helotiales sp. DMI_Dod_QoI]
MLLNKRLTTFLSQNATPQLPTLLLLSPTGKLLTSTSPLSASALRTQATLACSLWVLYQPSIPSLISSALPQVSHKSSQNDSRGSESTISSASTATATEHELSTITIQLTHGVMVIRELSCGLLFVAIGSSPTPSSPHSSSHLLQGGLGSHTSPPSSPSPAGNGEEYAEGSTLIGRGSATASEAGSVRSVSGRTGIMGIRRQADEVGRWLDGQLEGFTLSSGEGR